MGNLFSRGAQLNLEEEDKSSKIIQKRIPWNWDTDNDNDDTVVINLDGRESQESGTSLEQDDDRVPNLSSGVQQKALYDSVTRVRVSPDTPNLGAVQNDNDVMEMEVAVKSEKFTPLHQSTPVKSLSSVKDNQMASSSPILNRSESEPKKLRHIVPLPPVEEDDEIDQSSIGDDDGVGIDEVTIRSSADSGSDKDWSQGSRRRFPKDTKRRIGRPPKKINLNVTLVGNDPPMYQCKVCKKTFKTKSHSRYHLYCGKGIQTFPLKCDTCNMGFRVKTHLQYHLRVCHQINFEDAGKGGRGPFNCPYCSKTFVYKGFLTKHIKQHPGGAEEIRKRQFACAVGNCKKTFPTLHQINQHVAIVHGDGRPYSCRYCDKTYKRADHRTRHEKQAHKDQLQQNNQSLIKSVAETTASS